MNDIYKIAQIINESFHKAAKESNSEVDFLKKSTCITEKHFTEKNKNSNVSIKTGYIHQKPYAIFIDPKEIAGKSKTELGDILLVIKRRKKNITQREVTFIQVKWNSDKSSPSWKIEQHQRDFWKGIKTNKFSFGKKAFKTSGYTPIIFNGIKNEGDLCRYLFINPIFCEKYFGLLVKFQNIQNKNVFVAKDLIFYKYDIFKNVLQDILKGSGVKVNNIVLESSHGDSLSNILTIIYKYFGWVEDPPEEYETYFQGEGGFAIFEITINEEIENP